jgi:hypothetical protein
MREWEDPFRERRVRIARTVNHMAAYILTIDCGCRNESQNCLTPVETATSFVALSMTEMNGTTGP